MFLNYTYDSIIGFKLILESLFSTNIIFYTILKNPLLQQNRKTTIAVIEHDYIFITTTQIWVLRPVNFNEKNYLTTARSRLMKINFLGFLFGNYNTEKIRVHLQKIRKKRYTFLSPNRKTSPRQLKSILRSQTVNDGAQKPLVNIASISVRKLRIRTCFGDWLFWTGNGFRSY